MKTLAYTALVILILASCKKSGAPMPKEKLLAKIYENNELVKEFAYNADNRLKTVKTYKDGSVEPYLVDTYEYDSNGFLKEKNRVANGKLLKFLFQCNSAGQVIKMTTIDMYGIDSGKVHVWNGYTYNVQNRLIRMDLYESDDELLSYQELEYATNGGLVSILSYRLTMGEPELVQRWKFQGASGRVGPGMQKAFIEPDKKEFMNLDAKSYKVTTYAAGSIQSVTEVEMSGREAVGPGLLSKQTITLDNTFPIAGTPIVKNMRYEYVEQ